MLDVELVGPFVKNTRSWTTMTQSSNGLVGRDLRKRGRILVRLAQRSAGHDTGELSRSIESVFYPGYNPYVKVGSNVGHALVNHEGSRPHTISADDAGVVRFKVRGRIVYAQQVHHPGTKGTKFLTRHLRRIVQ